MGVERGSIQASRQGERENIPQRSRRYYHQSGGWFFHTREGADIGPFDDQPEAEAGFRDFMEFIALANPSTLLSFYTTLEKKSGNSAKHLH